MRFVTYRPPGVPDAAETRGVSGPPGVGDASGRSQTGGAAPARPAAPPRVGLVEGDALYGLDQPTTLLELIEGGAEALAAAAGRARSRPAEVLALDEAELLAPIPTPPSVRDFMAFEAHVATAARGRGETVDPDWYELPVFYFSNPASIRGPRDPVPLPPGSMRFDYELEVAAVVGRAASDLSVREAGGCVAGFVLLCDWSARDLQAREMRLRLGPAKGKDTATSLGPWLVTRDELEERRSGRGYDVALTASVNGRAYSAGNLAELYWSFEEMIAYASRGTRLRPGDVIGSGTVGTGCILELQVDAGADAYPWLAPGDTVRLEGGPLGVIESQVIPGPAPLALRTGS